METAEEGVAGLALGSPGPVAAAAPGSPAEGGSMSSLAELAAHRTTEGWGHLPAPLLGDIFRRLLEQQYGVDDLVRSWQGLALVCKGWLDALRSHTPICLDLSKPAHLEPAALSWLSRVPLEVLVLPKTILLNGADLRLLASEEFQAHSATALRTLMHAGPAVQPLLHHFKRLKQVALFYPEEVGQAPLSVDAAAFQQLPKLNCLTVAGYWGTLDVASLPTRLKHLSLSNFHENAAILLELPAGMKQLELLSLHAESVVLDWDAACARCEQIEVAAHLVLLGVGQEPMRRLIQTVGLADLQATLYRRMGAAMADGERFQEATLAFFNMALFTGPLPPDGGIVPIDADGFLQQLRDDLIPQGLDVNPALESYPDFVRDLPSPEPCFVLEVVKQEAGKPLSVHFTTPVSDAEMRLLTSKPVWRISWCEDERAAQVLADPQFVAHSAGTLTDLINIPFTADLDLRPFRKLLSVLGMLRCAPHELPALLCRMPRRIESLCLTAENLMEPRDFEAGMVRHLRELKEVSLYGHRAHDFSRLRRSINIVRIMNPNCGPSEPIGSGRNYSWPAWMSRQSGSSSSSSESEDESGSGSGSEWEEGGETEGDAEASNVASEDSFGSACSQQRSSRGGSPQPRPTAAPCAAAAPAETADGREAASEAVPTDGDSPAAGAPAVMAVPSNHAAAAAAGSSSSSSSDSEDDYMDAQQAQHGGHSHRHGGGAEDERHSKAACSDPFCALHSGKRFLQISLTDERPVSTIDFSVLLAGRWQMLTLTLTQENPNARCVLLHDGGWQAALAALNNSTIEVLELNCQAASMSFRSHSLLYRLMEVPVESAMKYVHKHYGHIWQVRSWNGNTATDGVVEGSRGYALMRKSVLEEQRRSAAPSASRKD